MPGAPTTQTFQGYTANPRVKCDSCKWECGTVEKVNGLIIIGGSCYACGDYANMCNECGYARDGGEVVCCGCEMGEWNAFHAAAAK